MNFISKYIDYWFFKPLEYQSSDVMHIDNGIPVLILQPCKYTNKDKCIIFSYGSIGNLLIHRHYWQYYCNELGIDVILYDYGKHPNEEQCYTTLYNVVKYYKLKYGEIYLIGWSLGTAVIIEYITRYDPDWQWPIILIAPLKGLFSCWISYDIMLPWDKYHNHWKIANIKCPIQIYHGVRDKNVPVYNSMQLFNRMQNKKYHLKWFPSRDHYNILNAISVDEYRDIIF